MGAIERKAAEPAGFIGSLQRSDLDPASLMKVWDAMDQDQKSAAKWVMKRKIVASKEISPEVQRQFLDRITSDLKSK